MEVRLQSTPNDSETLFLAARIATSFQQLDRAADYAERSVAIEPNSAKFLTQLAEIHARLAEGAPVWKQVAYVRRFHKEIEAARAANPRNVDAYLVDISFLSRAPLVAGGDKRRARALAEELIRIDPGWGYLMEARLAEPDKDYARMEHALLKAVEARPSFYEARFYLGRLYCCTSVNPDLQRAEHQAGEAIRLDRGQAGGYGVLAQVYARQQRWGDLERLLNEAESKVPDDLSPYYEAANALAARGQDFDRAARYLRKYLSQEPEGRQPTIAQGRQLLAAVTAKTRRQIEAGL